MRIKRKTLVGRINAEGDLIAPMQLLQDFCNLNRERSVIIRVEVQPQEAGEKIRNYVFGYVIPEMQRILHDNGEDYTRAQTFEYLKSICPVFLDEEYLGNGKWKQRKKEWEELDKAEVVEFVAWVQRLAAIEFNQIIQDPK
jgi:hypothetical protein